MFLARRPSRQSIDRFLLESQALPLSYGPIGILGAETVRHRLDEAVVSIGRGELDFARARDALMAWKQFDIGWVEAFPPHAPIAVGTAVAVLIRHLGFWSLNGCRVVYTVGGPGRLRSIRLCLRNADEPRRVWRRALRGVHRSADR